MKAAPEQPVSPTSSSPEQRSDTIREIVESEVEWELEVAQAFPRMRWTTRILSQEEGVAAFQARRTEELSRLSDEELTRFADYVRSLKDKGLNPTRFAAERRALSRGFSSLSDAERKLAEEQPRYLR